MTSQHQSLNVPTSDAEIVSIFPTPVFVKHNAITYGDLMAIRPLVDNFSDTGLQQIYGNTTADTYILNHSTLSVVRQKLLGYVHEYTTNVLGLAGEYDITQSWISVKQPGQAHLKHNHANSVVSGVLYFDNEDDTEGLVFLKNESVNGLTLSPIKDTNVNNIYSANTVTLGIKNFMLTLFPSSLMHTVDPNSHSSNRYSLAFNTMPKYQLGMAQSLTEFNLHNFVQGNTNV